ncbi:unnamed protein product, partial [Symbiodinium necroappetens]
NFTFINMPIGNRLFRSENQQLGTHAATLQGEAETAIRALRTIDRIKDSKPGSRRRTFEYVWNGLEDVLAEVREDRNEQALKESLKEAENKQKQKADAKAAAAKATPAVPPGKGNGRPKAKGQGTDKPPKAPTKATPGVPDAGGPGKGKGKGEGKGKGKGKGKDCPFEHVDAPKKAAPSKAAPKAALEEQGILKDALERHIQAAKQLRFETGNGITDSDDADDEGGDEDGEDELDAVDEFGQRIAADFIIVRKDSRSTETVVLVIRDEATGYIRSFPLVSRHEDGVIKSVLQFLGRYKSGPCVLVKSDNAREIIGACARFAAHALNLYHPATGIEGSRYLNAADSEFTGMVKDLPGDNVLIEYGCEVMSQAIAGIDAWFSLPCTHLSSHQSVNTNSQSPKYARKLSQRRASSMRMLVLALNIANHIIAQDGRVSFEWPSDSGVWRQKEWLDFAHKHEMSYVTNHGARIDARGERNHHKSSFTIASNSKRVLEHFAHGKKAGDYRDEHSDSATSAAAHEFADIVVEALYPQRREWQAEPKALEAIAEEARSQGHKLRVAELMTLCGVKHAELAPEFQKFKGRIVYRGDRVLDEFNNLVFFEETSTTPTGLAYLQSELREETYVILPRELWLEGWATLARVLVKDIDFIRFVCIPCDVAESQANVNCKIDSRSRNDRYGISYVLRSDQLADESYSAQYINSKDQLANGLTKVIPPAEWPAMLVQLCLFEGEKPSRPTAQVDATSFTTGAYAYFRSILPKHKFTALMLSKDLITQTHRDSFNVNSETSCPWPATFDP